VSPASKVSTCGAVVGRDGARRHGVRRRGSDSAEEARGSRFGRLGRFLPVFSRDCAGSRPLKFWISSPPEPRAGGACSPPAPAVTECLVPARLNCDELKQPGDLQHPVTDLWRPRRTLHGPPSTRAPRTPAAMSTSAPPDWQPTLEGSLVRLRPLREDDFAALLRPRLPTPPSGPCTPSPRAGSGGLPPLLRQRHGLRRRARGA
jgi:hypothetical protein